MGPFFGFCSKSACFTRIKITLQGDLTQKVESFELETKNGFLVEGIWVRIQSRVDLHFSEVFGRGSSGHPVCLALVICLALSKGCHGFKRCQRDLGVLS